MIYWAPLLHFYQPPTQLPAVLDRICDECYRPLLDLLAGSKGARATCNVSGSLTELLQQQKHGDVLDRFRALAEAGQIELTGTAMYHPILPLVPAAERRRQIQLNHQIGRRVFGEAFQPRGFFPPELAFAPSIVPSVADSGHEWIVLSGVASPNGWPLDVVERVETDGAELAVFFRDDVLSNRIAFRDVQPPEFARNLRSLRGARDDVYVITAMDAETFGHHIPGWDGQFLGQVFSEVVAPAPDGAVDLEHGRDDIAVATISDLLDRFPVGDSIVPKPSSWSTSGDDLAANNPFPLWNDHGNQIHRLQWEVTRLACELVQRAESAADTDASREFARIARGQLDRALHSCQYWWASRRPWWEINMIHRGVLEFQEALLNATRSVRSSGSAETTKRDAMYRFVAARELSERIVDQLLE